MYFIFLCNNKDNHVIFRIEFDNSDFSQSLQKVPRFKDKLNATSTITIESLFSVI